MTGRHPPGSDGSPDGVDSSRGSPTGPAATRTEAATSVGPSDAPAVCSRCGRPFPDGDLLALHRGLAHRDALDEAEVAAYERASRDEDDALRVLRLQALAALVVLYFALLFAYAAFG